MNAGISFSQIASEILEFQVFTQQLRVARSISYSILTLILLEIIFTFDKEIRYIWRRPWSLFKVFFIACRYLSIIPTFIAIVSPPPRNIYCRFEAWYLGLVIILVSLLPSSGLLAIRLDRLYASTSMRRTLVFLVFVLTAEVISQIGVSMTIVPQTQWVYNPLVRECAATFSKSEWLSKSLTMLPYLILVCMYILIAGYAFIRHCREKASLSSIWAVRRNFAPFYIIFIRDGVLCYIINFLGIFCGFVLLIAISSENALAVAGPAIIVGITSISSCRLALLLHGDPGHAIGVYQLDTIELRVETLKDRNSITPSIRTFVQN